MSGEGYLEQLQAMAEEVRELLVEIRQERRGIRQDLRELREARQAVRDEIDNAMEHELITQKLAEQFDWLKLKIEESAAVKSQQVGELMSGLVNLYMYGNEQGRGENVLEKLTKYLEADHLLRAEMRRDEELARQKVRKFEKQIDKNLKGPGR